MLTGDLRNQIDRIWDAFWSGGIANPLEVIEQITYLLILRLQLCILNAEPGYDRLREQVRAIAGALEEQSSIPAVREQMLLIEAVAGEEWWQESRYRCLKLRDDGCAFWSS